jgi:hypothetical protein
MVVRWIAELESEGELYAKGGSLIQYLFFFFMEQLRKCIEKTVTLFHWNRGRSAPGVLRHGKAEQDEDDERRYHGIQHPMIPDAKEDDDHRKEEQEKHGQQGACEKHAPNGGKCGGKREQ